MYICILMFTTVKSRRAPSSTFNTNVDVGSLMFKY